MKLLLYCCRAKPYLYKSLNNEKYFVGEHIYTKYNKLNGKIIGECDFNVEKMGLDTGKGLIFENGFNKESQLKILECAKYVGNNYYYAIHIKNLKLYNEPRDLFHYTCVKGPRNMQYVYSAYDKNENILISIQSQWLVKILNGVKTVEVRKKVLKGMIKNGK